MADGETFTCAGCGETFPRRWTDAEALAEFRAKYPDELNEELAVLCDPCAEDFDAWMRRHGQ